MARYIGSKCRLCRKVGEKLFLKTQRCLTEKCSVQRRAYPPGLKGQERKKSSDYKVMLYEKQKAKHIYGVLERPFRNYFHWAERQKGITGENLLILLERRLDNIIYRLGLAGNRTQARQLVRHNHIVVNGRKVNIPSFLVKKGDIVTVKEKSKEEIRNYRKRYKSPAIVPGWLELDEDKLLAKMVQIPTRGDIDTKVNENLIVVLYSK